MTVYEELVNLLIEKKYTLSAAESCTGGTFVSGVAGVPDASKVLSESFVTYSNGAKIKYAGVKKDTLDKYGAVSENVAVEMAKGVCLISGCNAGVGITGFAGPSGGAGEKPVGTVCFGFCLNGKTASSTKYFGNIGRNAVRELSSVYAAKTLCMLLKAEGKK